MTAWEGTGRAYAASYAELCAGTIESIVEELGAGRGRPALDVGAGIGELAARLSAHGWSATAAEPESSMRVVAGHRHPRLSLVDAALPGLPFADASFAAVTANFVLNHVDDPRRSAAELLRVAAPAGVVAASIWTRSPSWFWGEVVEESALPRATGGRLPPEKDFERTAEGFASMLRAAGWATVSVTEEERIWRASPEMLWASVEGGVASAGGFYQLLDGSARIRFRAAFDTVSARYDDAGTIALEHVAAIAVQRRSSA
ncbi:class I SAM-dependent methyltransferase [uncultured Microbacterium sp.]|uniref:class I SAM-dependent methyltransferase n=1 Tax=uncultured Microbacterium sp. TaxID=191216 RepID=UPI0026125474|nr:class I SAM-dependent methyltransferase [uncultured Microbacterium sp.]